MAPPDTDSTAPADGSQKAPGFVSASRPASPSPASPAAPDENNQVSTQISDAISQVNVSTIGIGPAYAALQSMLAQSQAQSILMANMVSSQRQTSITGLSTLTRSIERLLDGRS
ncbi:RebB family R body protein [Thalassospira sp.]|uniref:RebB family R body protein n=1 Tax=Thalassospira sp. TaxID=1912094 RepID=UPI002732FF5C|nr:RebB family R body protein [Thalassospira sp.]MDP2696883.1 RebB family R body protein [Thalassospira sp.]